MNRTMITMALLGAAGLVAACGGGDGGDTGGTSEDTGSALTAPIDAAKQAAGDLEKASGQVHTLTFTVGGMT